VRRFGHGDATAAAGVSFITSRYGRGAFAVQSRMDPVQRRLGVRGDGSGPASREIVSLSMAARVTKSLAAYG
jgi:hypothetical protein